MADEKEQQVTKQSQDDTSDVRDSQKPSSSSKRSSRSGYQGQRKNGGEGDGRRRRRPSAFGRSGKRRSDDRPKSEFETRVLSARRVSRVVAGGRRFSLSVAVEVGNRKGKVGVGTGKGIDMAAAMEKARHQAQKGMVEVRVTDEKGIPSEAIGKYCASVVCIRPNQGFVAGGAARTVAELAGVEHINAKIQSRSKCHLNNARAMLKAFTLMSG